MTTLFRAVHLVLAPRAGTATLTTAGSRRFPSRVVLSLQAIVEMT